MKNIIVVLLIFIIPVIGYFVIKGSGEPAVAVSKNVNNPTLITFTSTMCTDCKRLKEVIKEVEPEYSDRVNFVKYNALDNNNKIREAVKEYNVVLVPTMVFLDKTGNTKNRIEGFIPKEQLITELEGMIND